MIRQKLLNSNKLLTNTVDYKNVFDNSWRNGLIVYERIEIKTKINRNRVKFI